MDTWWKIALDEETQRKTSVIAHDKLNQYERTFFGLAIAPATFQLVINMI